MAAPCYIAWAGVATALTSPPPAVTTSAVANTPKTILQVKAPATPKIRIIEWGYSLTAAPTGPLAVELIETGTVFATVTQGSVANYTDATGPASQAQLGTAATGFNASAEGVVTASRLLAYNMDLATVFKQQFPLGREPEISAGACLRIRATPTVAAASFIQPYIIWEE